MVGISTIIPENFEMRLNEAAAFGNVLSCLHLISCQHPDLDVYMIKTVLARMRSLIVSGTKS